jgi:nicotinamide-nucleotide amidase
MSSSPPSPIAWILSQGDEVVTGQIADGNAAFLSSRLVDLGFRVTRHVAVGDVLDDIRGALVEAARHADVCICTGGLGPTDDDLTRRAAAEAFERPLVFDPAALATIEAMFARFHRPMPAINERQAWLPSGSTRLDNDWGTAPGFGITHGRSVEGRAPVLPGHPSPGNRVESCWFVFLPGVPREMEPMFAARVEPMLHERFALRPGRLVTIRTTGIGESDMQSRVGDLAVPGVTIGTRTILPENHLKLRFAADVAEADVKVAVAEAVRRLGPAVFAIDGLDAPGGSSVEGMGLRPLPGRRSPLHDYGGGSLAEVVGRRLAERGETLAVAESCTGGRVAAMCTAIAGSSRWFVEGMVAYANEAKVRHLGVSRATLAAHGAVSEATCREMAAGLRERAGTTYALAITGIAGPDGGTPEKPVGTVHLALAHLDGLVHRAVHLGGDRRRIQELAAGAALDLLRRNLFSRGEAASPPSWHDPSR